MPRPSSKIMTPGDLRAAKAALKKELALVNAEIKTVNKAVKADSIAFDKAVKASQATLAAANKQHIKTVKGLDKVGAKQVKKYATATAVATKAKTKLEARLAALDGAALQRSPRAEAAPAPVQAAVVPIKRGPGRPRKDAQQAAA